MKKPVLFVEHLPCDRKHLSFDFCYSALMGARHLGIEVKGFEDSDEVPPNPTNILVGSVEMCSKWLDRVGFSIPNQIDPNLFKDFLGRKIWYSDIRDINTKNVFIKPATKIKAFTGFIVDNPKMIPLWSHQYEGIVQVQDVIDIVSEYRCYISNNKIIGMKHYSGDPLRFPSRSTILECKEIGDKMNYHSYVLDFGVLSDGSTILIEPNDAWAIGNYGLDPQQYYLFIRNRWLQMTGIRKHMDGI